MKATKLFIDFFNSEKAGGLVLIACKISSLTAGLLEFITLKLTLKTEMNDKNGNKGSR
jgi:hypothetical protein